MLRYEGLNLVDGVSLLDLLLDCFTNTTGDGLLLGVTVVEFYWFYHCCYWCGWLCFGIGASAAWLFYPAFEIGIWKLVLASFIYLVFVLVHCSIWG